MTGDKYEDEIYERVIQLERKAKRLFIQHSKWESVIDMLNEDEREEYDELIGMYDELMEENTND